VATHGKREVSGHSFSPVFHRSGIGIFVESVVDLDEVEDLRVRLERLFAWNFEVSPAFVPTRYSMRKNLVDYSVNMFIKLTQAVCAEKV